MKCLFGLLFLVASLQAAYSQHRHLLSGTIRDLETGEPLMGATVVLKALNKGGVTNTVGYYSIEAEADTYEVVYSYIGYADKVIHLPLHADQVLNIDLVPVAIQTTEILVSDKRDEENVATTIDHIRISQQEIKKLPYLLGEVDPLKMLQLLPGVQSNGEGNNGIYVRGGSIDQNLILFDQVPIYNMGHLFGFFSLFNNSIIRDVNLIKGGIPPGYGGRLASVLEINSRNGDYHTYKGEASLGLVSGNLSVEGPIVKGKSSFIVGGRRTYIDLLSKAITRSTTIFNTGIDYHFDDLNARVDWKPGTNDRIALSGFSGTDDFFFNAKKRLANTIRWKNYTGSLTWEHFYSDKNYHTASLFVSRYKMDLSAAISTYAFNIASSIEDYGARTEWTIGSLPGHRIRLGAEYVRHAIVPNNMKASSTSQELSFVEMDKIVSQEQAIYVGDEWQVSENFSMAGGLRLSAYQHIGPFTRYVTDANLTLLDTTFYQRNSIAAAYWNLDPRLALVYQFSEPTSLKATFDRMHQYLHMAPVSSVSLPTDIWVPSSAKVKPQRGHQYSVGLFRNMRNNSLETSLTVYYKHMDRQLEYREGVIVGYSKGFNYDDNFIFGKGRSYGAEVFLKKSKGRLTGWLSYTLSRTTRTFADINQGQPFAAKYDRLHNFSVVGTYQLNDRWSLSGVLTYSTGNALTLPVGRYIIGGNIINEYGGRNTFRMPAYHRMDLSATYTAAKRPAFESYWVFSVYNAYNRRNPYYIYFDTEGNVNDYYLKVSLEKVSLFPIIPSVAYQVKF